MLRDIVQKAMSVPSGKARTFRVGAAVIVVAHRGKKWGVRVTYTTPYGVATARIVASENLIREALRRSGTLIGDDADIIGAARETLLQRMANRAAHKSAKQLPGPVGRNAYARLTVRRREGAPSGGRVVIRPGSNVRRLSWGLHPFPLRRR
jgi:hypothetical protein